MSDMKMDLSIRGRCLLILLLAFLLPYGCGSSKSPKSKSPPKKAVDKPKVKSKNGSFPQAAMGVMVGEVTPKNALVQVRLTQGTKPIDNEVKGMAGYVEFSLTAVNGDAQSTINKMGVAQEKYDYIVRVEFTNLTAGTAYKCTTKIGVHNADGPDTTQTGPVATFRTLQGTASDRPSKFVVVTGMNYGKFHGDNRINKAIHKKHNNTALPRAYSGSDKHLGYPALQSILKLKPDFFVGTGDNVYYDTPKKPRAKTIPQMRQKWHEQFVQPRYVDLFAAVPTYWEIDDHDYRIDDGDNTGDHDPSPQVAQQIMKEQLPYGAMGAPDVKTYRTRRVNRDLQVWFVENRIYRSPNAMKEGPDKSIWGKQQKAWLKTTLQASDAKFKVLVSPNPMIGPDDARKSDNHTNIGGFRNERDEFFKWLVESGVAKKHFYLICGDRHWQYHSIHPLGMEEFSCGALVDANSRPGRKPGDPKSTDPKGLIKQVYSQDKPSGGFLLVATAPAKANEPATLTFTFHDERGAVLYSHVKR